MFPSSCPCPKALSKFAHSAFVTEWIGLHISFHWCGSLYRHLNKISEITMCVAAPSCRGFSLVSRGFIDFRPWSDRVYVGAQPLTSWPESKKKKRPGSHNPFQGHIFFIDLRTDSRPYIVKAPPPPNDAPLGTFET